MISPDGRMVCPGSEKLATSPSPSTFQRPDWQLERRRNRTCYPCSNARTVSCSTHNMPVEKRIACGASRVRWPYECYPLAVTMRDATNGNAADRSHILALSLPHPGKASQDTEPNRKRIRNYPTNCTPEYRNPPLTGTPAGC